MTKYCPHCGEPSTFAGARFCGKCGAALPEQEQSQFQQTGIPYGKPYPSMSLFDINRQYYVVRRQWWGWGSGTIHDEQGQIIGHMHRRLFTIRQKTEFREADDVTLSATINRKIVAIRDTIDIKDGQEQILGRVRQKILTLFRPKVWMEDTLGNKILEAQGNFLGFSFLVQDMKGNVIAEIDKLDKWKDIFLGGGIFDFENMYAIVIHDPHIDRRLILPLAIAIDEVVHEDRKDRRGSIFG